LSNSIADGIEEFINELIADNHSLTTKSRGRRRIRFEQSIEYNAIRILIITKYCGKDGINSKIQFAFFDFLLRYPACLKYSIDRNDTKGILEEFSMVELTALDTKMVKHLHFAWDPDYFNYLSYLHARGLIEIDFSQGLKIRATQSGESVLKKLHTKEALKLIRRSKIIKKLFSNQSDQDILTIIKTDFPFVIL
jgi:hypothetical protein